MFVDRYKKIKIGSKIRIRACYILHGSRQVPHTFIEWIARNGNLFTVEGIFETSGTALINVEEVNGAVEYDQIKKVSQSKRMLNWRRNQRF